METKFKLGDMAYGLTDMLLKPRLAHGKITSIEVNLNGPTYYTIASKVEDDYVFATEERVVAESDAEGIQNLIKEL